MERYTNNYDRLYNNMKENFTVASSDCSLGEYMLMKVAKKKNESNLPVAARPSASRSERTVSLIYNYVEDKLTIKTPPQQDATIRAFPLRTSMAAFLSAMVVCTFLISFGLIGSKVLTPKSNLNLIDSNEVEIEETVIPAEESAVALAE